MNTINDLLETVNFQVNVKSDTYYNSDGVPVPRVTEILSSMIHSDGLMYWANSIGLRGQRYKTVLDNAAKIGTAAHNAIELFLKDKIRDSTNIPFLGFEMWHTIVEEHFKMPIEIIYVEHKMSCKYFGGTLDCLARIGGRLFLIDFKTSNHVTFNYFLQLAAYRYMLRVTEGIEVEGCIVLQLDKDEPGFNEYVLDFMVQEHLMFINNCERTFLSLVYGFINVKQVEGQFREIF